MSVRRLDVPEIGASIGRHFFRHTHLTCKVVEARGVVAEDLLIAPTRIPTSEGSWPVVTVVLEGQGLVRAGDRGEQAMPRDLVWTPPGLDYRGRGGDGGRLLALLVQWDPAVFGGTSSGNADRARLHTRDFDRLRAAIADAQSAGHDGQLAAGAVERICAALRALGLLDARPTAADLHTDVAPDLARAGRAVDALLSNPRSMPAALDLQARIHRSPAQARRLVTTYADVLRAQGATGWREMLHAWRLYVGATLMTAERATTEAVARALGYRSPAAFCHAFALAGMRSPGAIRSLVRQLA